jgi:hypothetical protein
LSEYPPEIVDYVCDPRTGSARRLKRLPMLAENAEACEQKRVYAESVAKIRATKASEQRAIIADPQAPTYAKEPRAKLA